MGSEERVVAAIDLGSNTVKMTVAALARGAPLRVVEEHAEITRVGEGLDRTGALLEAAMARTHVALAAFVARARALGAEHIACVATAGMRGATNATTFLEAARREHELEVEIIHGLREAELAFLGPAQAHGAGPIVVVDVGGRSTELITGMAGALGSRASLELGAVRYTERFLAHDPPRPEELDALAAATRDALAEAPQAEPGARVIGVSGTVTALFGLVSGERALDAVLPRAEGAVVPRAALSAELERLAALPAAQRIQGTVLPAGRADVVVAGLTILREILDRYGAAELHVSTRGVRFGLLAELARDRAPRT